MPMIPSASFNGAARTLFTPEKMMDSDPEKRSSMRHRRPESIFLARHFVHDAPRDEDGAADRIPLTTGRRDQFARRVFQQDDAFFRPQHVETTLENQIQQRGQRDGSRQCAVHVVERPQACSLARVFRQST